MHHIFHWWVGIGYSLNFSCCDIIQACNDMVKLGEVHCDDWVWAEEWQLDRDRLDGGRWNC